MHTIYFYEELYPVFDKFPKYHINILLGNFGAKIGREVTHTPAQEKQGTHTIIKQYKVQHRKE
jgi:hypothetical protein